VPTGRDGNPVCAKFILFLISGNHIEIIKAAVCSKLTVYRRKPGSNDNAFRFFFAVLNLL
jgi:hypothetical protein